MNINIICIGKIKESYLIEAINEYKKRLSCFVKLDIIELKEENLKIENEANIKKAKDDEGDRIIEKINQYKKSYNIALSIDGKEYSTIDFLKKINDIKLNGISDINFIIGGSYGLSDNVYKKVNHKISFSKMTFPHQLFRVIILEQLYRIFKIDNNEPYHK